MFSSHQVSSIYLTFFFFQPASVKPTTLIVLKMLVLWDSMRTNFTCKGTNCDKFIRVCTCVGVHIYITVHCIRTNTCQLAKGMARLLVIATERRPDNVVILQNYTQTGLFFPSSLINDCTKMNWCGHVHNA